MTSQPALEAFVRSLGIDMHVDELANLLVNINRYPTRTFDVPPALRGIAGLTTTMFLQTVIFVDGKNKAIFLNEKKQPVYANGKRAFGPDGNSFRGSPIATPVFYGKIRDITLPRATEGGHQTPTGDEKMNGHLGVDMCIDDVASNTRRFYHWDIEVVHNGFSVTERDDSNPSNPFGLAMAMPAGALDRDNRHSIWYRDLKYKLGAKGESIKVRNVYFRELSSKIRQKLERLSQSHQYYQTSADSCIDLFTPHYPPATFIELDGNDYCLGRCAHPAIYNSGE